MRDPHLVTKILEVNCKKFQLSLEFDSKETRVVDLSKLINNSPNLRRVKLRPELVTTARIHKGGLEIFNTMISGPTLYHMGIYW